MIWLLVCPVCDAAHEPHERFCADCGVPLTFVNDPTSELTRRARKVKPEYAQGPLVRVAFARHQSEAEMIQNLLLEEGIPSLAQRTRGFDVPDFLAAGPRNVLVAASGEQVARELLGDRTDEQRFVPMRRPPWMRATAITLSLVVLAGFAGSVLLPFA